MRKATIIFYFLTIFGYMVNAQTKIFLNADGKTMTASLVDNAATRTLVNLLEKCPLRIEMEDYGGFEKVGELPQALPTSDTHVSTSPGDIMLYQGNSIVIFYGTNSWNYTPIGKIDDATAADVKAFLGNGDISLEISMTPLSGIDESMENEHITHDIYNLQGMKVNGHHLKTGIYIIDGRKTVVGKH